MTWDFWCFFSIVLNSFIIVIKAKGNFPSLIIENIIPKIINLDLLRIDIKQIDGTVLHHLNFKKTKGFLANCNTPVIKFLDNIEKEILIKFYHDYEIMQGIGNFSFYHDIDNKASAVLFSDSDGFYLDGIIGDTFKLNRFPLSYIYSTSKRSERHIIKESDSHVESLKEDIWSKLNNAVEDVGAFYPELLIVLDYNLIANVSKIQAIKTQLVYWNAVDMLFASMKSPEIYLNIAAFILPSSKYEFQFLANDPGTTFIDFYDAIEGVETLFYKYRDQISVDYDIIVAMTGAKLCVRPTRANPVMNCINGISDGKPDTLNKFDYVHETVDSSAILHFDNQVSSYTNAAQKIGFMFTGEFTQKKEMKRCPGIMEEYYRRRKVSLSWSNCTRRKVSDYLRSPKAEGLKNFPKYLLEKKKCWSLPIVPPKPSDGWLSSLGNWLFKKNTNKNDEISDVIITTQPSVYDATQLTITTEASLSEASGINEHNFDLQQEFITSEESLAELTDIVTTTERFLPQIIEKIRQTTEQVPEINEPNADLEPESTKPETFLDNFSKTPNSELRIEDLPSTTTKLLVERNKERQDDNIFIDVTVPSEESNARVSDDHPNVSENNLEEPTVNFELNKQNLSNASVDEPVVEEQIVRRKRQNLLNSKTPIILDDHDELLAHKKEEEKVSDEDLIAHEREEEKVSDEDLIAHEREKEKVSDDPIVYEREREKVKRESSFNNLIDTETVTETVTEQYYNQNDSIPNINKLNNYETATELIIEHLDQNESVLVQNNSTTAVAALISVTESSSSSIESISSSTQSSCKREKMELDVTLELNINTNDKNIKTLKKSFHDGLLNQENENATDTNDKRVIKNMIDYLLKNADG